MKSNRFAIAVLLTATALAAPARAENLEHTQRLLSTKQCQRCDLVQAGLVHANLGYADLVEADLRGANLSRADLRGADLSGANLSGASLFGANLTGANLSGAIVRGTDFRQAYMVDANVAGAELSYAYLREAVGLHPSAIGAQNFYNWGVDEADRGDYQSAIEHYDRAVTIDPKFAQAYMDRALAYAQLGQYEKAVADSTKAGELFAIAGNQDALLLSQNFNETMVAVQERKEKRARGGGGGNFLNFLGSLGSLLLPLIKPF